MEMRMPRANLAIQVVPLGGADDRAAIEIAIRCIRESGLKHVVGPMETTIEGDSSDELIRVALACLLYTSPRPLDRGCSRKPTSA